ncbi:MAG TPA: signal peptidase I, partial [Cyanobacteria bacterium UBA8543]|nr:signal peptidase I [Cyanobacteria bacterium UBA8543]
MFFPGIGQIYSGKVIKGCIFIVIQVLLYFVSLGLLISSEINMIGLIILFIAINVLILVVSCLDAYKNANNINFETTRKRNKDPWRSVFLSRIIPGLGHLYIGKKTVGLLLLIIWGVSLIIPLISILLLILSPFVIYNSYIAAPVQREPTKKTII